MPKPQLKITMPTTPTLEDLETEDGVLVLPVDGKDVPFTDTTITLPDGRKVDPRVLRETDEIGHGAYGRVVRVVYDEQILAVKYVRLSINSPADDSSTKRLYYEIEALREAHCPFIVNYYGTYLSEGDLALCMEFMDGGSLDDVYRRHGAIQEPYLSKIVVDIVRGLNYLYTEHQIIHRDVKPSNILFNSRGEIKLCDLGISGRLKHSVAQTYVGTSTYLSPERISGRVTTYGVEADVWSLGITIVELATGQHPFSEGCKSGRVYDILKTIVSSPAPRLPHSLPGDLRAFAARCVEKNEKTRPKYPALLADAFVARVDAQHTDLAIWARSVMPEHALKGTSTSSRETSVPPADEPSSPSSQPKVAHTQPTNIGRDNNQE